MSVAPYWVEVKLLMLDTVPPTAQGLGSGPPQADPGLGFLGISGKGSEEAGQEVGERQECDFCKIPVSVSSLEHAAT